MDERDTPSDAVRLEVDILDTAGEEAEPEPSDGEDGLTLLVADDDPEIRWYVRRCVRSFRGPVRRVLEAADGRSALRILEQDGADVLVCDVRMPGLDGFELCAAVRRDPRLAGLPVLLITGQVSQAQARRRADRVGADAVLPKPFNARRLCEAIEAVLDIRAPPDRAGLPPESAAEPRTGEEAGPDA